MEIADLSAELTKFTFIPGFNMYQENKQFYVQEEPGMKGKIYRRVSSKPLTFFVIDFDQKSMGFVNVIPNEDDISEAEETKYNEIAYFSADKVIRYMPMYKGGSSMYEWFIATQMDDTAVIGPEYSSGCSGEIGEIQGAIPDPTKVGKVLQEAALTLHKAGLMEKRYDPPYDGFFHIARPGVDHSDSTACYTPTLEYEEATEEDLYEAVNELEELSTHYEEFLPQLNFVLHWTLMSPFSYLKRQKGDSDKMGALYLYGTSRVGKTIMCLLGAHIWQRPLEDTMKSHGDLHSEANFGKVLSETTFPILFDEGEKIFSRTAKWLTAMFKNAVFYLHVRGRYNPHSGRYEQIPALAPVMITSNSSSPNNAALGARMNTIEFMRESIRSEADRRAFNERFDPENSQGPLSKLGAIGAFTANYIQADPSILDNDWKTASEIIWNAVYEHAGMETPEWMQEISNATEDLENTADEEEAHELAAFRKLVLKSSDVYSNESERVVTIEEKVQNVVKGAKADWISQYVSQRGANKGQAFVEVDAGIGFDLEREFDMTISLKMLAAKLNGVLTTVRRGKKVVKVVRWPYQEFLEMFISSDEE